MALRVLIFVLAVVLLGSAPVLAAEISSGSVRVDNLDSLICIAQNVGSTAIASVRVRLHFNKSDGTSRGTN